MIPELVVSTLLMTGSLLTEEEPIQKIIKKHNIKNQWKTFNESIEENFKIGKVILKYYGFDAIILIPMNKTISDLRKYIFQITTLYQAKVIIEPAENKTSAYMRVADNEKDLKDIDKIKFIWYSTFYGRTDRNNLGETYSITSYEKILNPNKEKETIVGYHLFVKIHEGFSFDELQKYEEVLNNTIGKCYMKWDKNRMRAIVTIITKPLSNKEKFVPIPCKPYELYVAMGYDYKPIICNFKVNCNLASAGQQGSGKTISIIQAMINLAYWNDNVDYFVGFVTYKTDLRILKDLKQTKAYITNLDDLYKMFKYLSNLSKHRNKVFTNCKEVVFNIYEYNEYAKKNNLEQMNLTYFITDEITDFMPKEGEDKTITKKKQEIACMFWDLCRLSRSSGIYMIISSQRMTKENVSAEVKGQMGNRICFYQPNTASALSVFGNGDSYASKITRLEKTRECYIENHEEITLAKTLYLDRDLMKKYISKNIEINKEYIDFNEKTSENNRNSNKKSKKGTRFLTKYSN